MKLEIVFEDNEILVVDKPSGLVVNRSETIKEETLQDQLSKYFGLESGFGPPATPRELVLRGGRGIGDRAGIIHRLDRETSGLLLVAKTQEGFEFLQRQFKERKVEKKYICLVHGDIDQTAGTIEADVGRIGKFGKFGIVKEGRESKTEFKVIEKYQFKEAKFNQLLYPSSDPPAGGESRSSRLSSNNNYFLSKSRINYLKKQAKKYTLLNLFPKTGRTHQIRVHIKSIGHPAVSDLIYAPKRLLKFDFLWCPRLFLHASEIKFSHPKSKKNVEFKSDLPGDLKDALSYLTPFSFAKRQLRGAIN